MNANALLFTGLQSLIGAAIAVLVPMLVKFLLSKTTKEDLNKYVQLANIAVLAVQQTIPDANAEDKKQAAVNKLSALTKGALTPDQVDHLIESSVFLMKQQFDTDVKNAPAQPNKAPIGFTSPAPASAPATTVEQPAK